MLRVYLCKMGEGKNKINYKKKKNLIYPHRFANHPPLCRISCWRTTGVNVARGLLFQQLVVCRCDRSLFILLKFSRSYCPSVYSSYIFFTLFSITIESPCYFNYNIHVYIYIKPTNKCA